MVLTYHASFLYFYTPMPNGVLPYDDAAIILYHVENG